METHCGRRCYFILRHIPGFISPQPTVWVELPGRWLVSPREAKFDLAKVVVITRVRCSWRGAPRTPRHSERGLHCTAAQLKWSVAWPRKLSGCQPPPEFHQRGSETPTCGSLTAGVWQLSRRADAIGDRRRARYRRIGTTKTALYGSEAVPYQLRARRNRIWPSPLVK
jgi:hypothetical protein